MEMGKQGAAARRFPFQGGSKRPRVKDQEHQTALARKMAPRGFNRLIGGGEMNKSIREVHGGAIKSSDADGVLPRPGVNDLVQAGQADAPAGLRAG